MLNIKNGKIGSYTVPKEVPAGEFRFQQARSASCQAVMSTAGKQQAVIDRSQERHSKTEARPVGERVSKA
jgi:hypothetical protein